MVLLLLLFLVSSAASVNISMTTGDLCEGAVATWTCVVDGSGTEWRNLGETVSPTSVGSLVALGPGSPFSVTLISITGTIITSIATANLTSAVDGSTLDCSDGSFSSPSTTISNVTLLLKNSSAVPFITKEVTGNSLSELVIHICWPKSICAPSYQLNINNQPVITEDTCCYQYSVPAIGTYTISVSSIDYFGRMVGDPATTTVHIRPPNITVGYRFNCDSNIISIIIQDSTDDQLPITSCNIRLTDGGSFDIYRNCIQGRLVVFTDIMCEQSYTYNVTVSNVIDSTTESGPINLAIIQPSTSFCSSTIMTSSPCTPCPTETPCPPLPPCELCLWALIVIIVAGVLVASGVAFITLELCWRLRCCNIDCWDSIFWNYLFCDCLKNCCPKDKRVNTSNLRTKSPDEKKETAFF